MIISLLAAASIVLSNLIHGIDPRTTLVQAAIPIVIASLSGLLLWFGRKRPSDIAWVCLGAVGSHLIFVLTNGTTYFDVNPWKYGLALPLTLCLMFIVLLLPVGTKTLTIMALISAGIYSFFADFRSMAAIAIAAIVFVVVFNGRRQFRLKLGLSGLGTLLFIIVVGGYALYWWAVSSGLMPQELESKYEFQLNSGNILLVARPELIGSWIAISAAPVIGLGSMPALDQVQMAQAVETLAGVGAVVTPDELERLFGAGLNSHSLLFGAWVRSGVLGALPWLFMIYLGIRSMTSKKTPKAFVPLASFWTLVVTWDNLFSAYQPHLPVMMGAFVAFSLAISAGPSPSLPSNLKNTHPKSGRIRS